MELERALTLLDQCSLSVLVSLDGTGSNRSSAIWCPGLGESRADDAVREDAAARCARDCELHRRGIGTTACRCRSGSTRPAAVSDGREHLSTGLGGLGSTQGDGGTQVRQLRAARLGRPG